MLNESRLLNFMSKDNNFSLQFFEGQKLVQDLAIIHSVKKEGFLYFRDISLSTLPLISLLKNTESFGVYIDSELPYFRFKVEMSKSGQIRTLMLPVEFDESPSEITGVCRLAKTTPRQQTPYTSIIELDKVNLKDLTNLILSQSYQIDGEVFISDYSDQSLLLMKLPNQAVDEDETPPTVKLEWMRIQKELLEVFKSSFNSVEEIVKELEKKDYLYLGSHEVKFKCNCSLDRMVQGIRSLASGDLDNVFEGKSEVEANCDYCHTSYKITRKMLSH